ncbi:MAG: preprotein translocase subunit SecG [Cytophagales bacterium]|nr:preprotein translocase subunit SecG [Cytophagales bacterium]
MFKVYIFFIVFFSLLLILLTLLQNSKRDNSVGNIIGSMGANQLIGITETTNILTKMTLFCIIAIFILSVFSYRSIRKNDVKQDSPNIEFAKKYKEEHTESNQ